MKKKWVEALETGYAYDSWTMALTDDQKSEKKNNDDACYCFLVMACENEPFDIITSETESNAFKGWEKLKEEYEPTTDKALILEVQ
jgi:hypothetical protein